MVKIRKLDIDTDKLKLMYKVDPKTLDELALPSLFHKNPLVRWITSSRIRRALSLIEFSDETKLLDFGCGPGVLLLQLPRNMGDLFGVDILLWPAKELIQHYDRKDISLLHSSNWVDEISDNYLDYIVATEVLEHIEDVISVLSTFRSKLKPGGKLIVSLPTENFVYELGRKIAGFSGDYHQEEIIDIEKVYSHAGFRLEKKVSIPARGFLCLYKLYMFSKK